MSKLGLRIGATVATLAVAGFATRMLSTAANLKVSEAAVDQLRDSDTALLQFTALQWLTGSGWGYVSMAVVLGVLFFIWKGQFKNGQE
jgi:hypothetical protein